MRQKGKFYMKTIKDKLTNYPKIIPLATAGLVGIFGTWFYFSPYLTVYGMQQAAERKDATELSKHVNFPALKDNVKSTLKAQVVKEVTKQGQQGNPFALLGLGLAESYINSVVNTMVSPEGIAAMVQGQTPDSQNKNAKQATNSNKSEVSMSYESFNSFVVHVKNKSAEKDKVSLVFLRDGLDWKLSAIRLVNI